MRQFDFLGKAKYFIPLTTAVAVTCAVLIVPQVRGIRPGLDFTGGTEFTVQFQGPVDTAAIRKVLGEIPASGTDLAASVIQSEAGGTTSVITTQLDIEANKSVIDQIESSLRASFSVTDVSRRSVGQKVTGETVRSAIMGVLLSLAAMAIYIAWRFKLRYGVTAVIMLIHDVTITMGILCLFRLEFNFEAIAGILTVIGYSLYDTMIIFDRVRENVALDRKSSMYDIINRSINQSLTRTLNTAGTTLAVVLILLILSGPVLRALSVALVCSCTIGTWSTFYVASPILHWWTVKLEGAKKAR